MDTRRLIKEYLHEAKLMQLATVAAGRPWVSSVWFAADDDLNLYWFSLIHRRHSKEVEMDPRVAGAIVVPHTPTDVPRGVQFEGTTKMLTDAADISSALRVYQDRIFPADKIRSLMESPDYPHHFYRITPSLYVLFDAKNFPEQSRQEWRP